MTASRARAWVFVSIFLAASALAILFWTQGEGETGHTEKELRLAQALSKIEGAGACEVYLWEESEAASSGKDAAAGALILCEGADDLSVWLRVQQAVHSATGIPVSSIEIYPIQERKAGT